MNGIEHSGVSQAAPGARSPDEKYPFWDVKDALVFLTSGLPALIAGGFAARTIFSFPVLSRAFGQAPELLTAQFLGYLVWFAFLWIILRTRYRRPFWKSLAWKLRWKDFPLHALSGVVLAVGVAAGGVLLQVPDIDMPIKRLLSSRSSMLLIGLAATTAGPLCEELAFRGFFLPLLIRGLGPAFGILATALPFALLHGPQYAWSWRHLLFITIAGAAFGLKRYRSGSTAAAAIMHAAYNVTFFTAYVVCGKDLPAKW
jgi:membrane protease YdiL (CAAX protease family)